MAENKENYWDEFEKTIKSISHEETNIIDTLSDLQAERIDRGISQKDFAKRINMTQPQLAKIESLDSMPTLTTLNRYAKGLNSKIKISVVDSNNVDSSNSTTKEGLTEEAAVAEITERIIRGKLLTETSINANGVARYMRRKPVRSSKQARISGKHRGRDIKANFV